MEKLKRRDVETFSLSFLDIIACGFGAIVLLLLIAKVGTSDITENIDQNQLLESLFSLQSEKEIITADLQKKNSLLENFRKELNQEYFKKNEKRDSLEVIKKNQTINESIKERLYIAQQSLTEEMLDILEDQPRDTEVGGIPVDSEYIIFVIDNSGSMTVVWDQLINEMSNILDIHPTIKGIQVLNDQGEYLMNSFQGRNSWIPDTPVYRNAIKELLRNQANLGISLSNPLRGIKSAINSHYTVDKKISIYVFGDDIRSISLEADLNEILRINTDINGNKKARIHGMAFPSQLQSEIVRFSHFMRRVSKENEGAFLGISIEGHSGYVDLEPGDVIPTDN